MAAKVFGILCYQSFNIWIKRFYFKFELICKINIVLRFSVLIKLFQAFCCCFLLIGCEKDGVNPIKNLSQYQNLDYKLEEIHQRSSTYKNDVYYYYDENNMLIESLSKVEQMDHLGNLNKHELKTEYAYHGDSLISLGYKSDNSNQFNKPTYKHKYIFNASKQTIKYTSTRIIDRNNISVSFDNAYTYEDDRLLTYNWIDHEYPSVIIYENDRIKEIIDYNSFGKGSTTKYIYMDGYLKEIHDQYGGKKVLTIEDNKIRSVVFYSSTGEVSLTTVYEYDSNDCPLKKVFIDEKGKKCTYTYIWSKGKSTYNDLVYDPFQYYTLPYF